MNEFYLNLNDNFSNNLHGINIGEIPIENVVIIILCNRDFMDMILKIIYQMLYL